ncbi:uncharacterized protein LOC133779417 [Humulus lupulus]|uniref:uncharacterized protein LOC133779417 n=1 Tax=Humulus lupulus TaxID=3486 RepID=UPI002B4009BB|nr:uncharacterized protein LOC133779417 [Humulus lupulus]
MDCINMLSWNVRGLNNKNKQQAVLDVCRWSKIGLGALIETKLKGDRLRDFMNSSFAGWNCYSSSVVEGHILLIWKAHLMKVKIIQENTQLLHYRVNMLGGNLAYCLLVVYGSNQLETRKSLWSDLATVQRPVNPWIIMGDFIAVFHVDDRIGGRHISVKEMEDARQWLALREATEMKTLGPNYTWSNKQDGGAHIFSKLDNVFSNGSWIDTFPLAVAYAQWDVESKANYQQAQSYLCSDPSNTKLLSKEKAAQQDYFRHEKIYASFLRQKSKITWLRFGDENSSYFHTSLKQRQISNHIVSYIDDNGRFVDDYDKVVDYYFQYFKNHLGTTNKATGQIASDCIKHGPVLSLDD